MEALRRDAKAVENTTWLKWLRRKRKTVNEWDEFDYYEREDTREREREYSNRYAERDYERDRDPLEDFLSRGGIPYN